MKILIMGAGAVGAYFGARLQQAGEQVVFCARGDNLKALRERGLEVRSFRGDFSLEVVATDEPREFAPYDLIIFAVKAYDSERAAERIQGCLSSDGVLLTLQNGVENEERLSDLLGKKVMGGNARVGVELVAPGKIVHVSTGTIDFGEMEGKSQRAERIAEVFRRAQILGEFTADMKTLRWQKLMWNAAFNTVTALTRRRVGEVLDDAHSRALVFRLMQEVRAVARAEGADITQDRIDALILHSERNLRALKTSTLQDLERGRRLEYDALTGAVVRAARRHRIDVPATETVYALMKLLDGRDAAP